MEQQKIHQPSTSRQMYSTQPQVRILIVDDDEDDFVITSEYIKKIPGRDFLIDWCYKYEVAIDKICDRGYDLYFVDYLLGPKTGLDLIREALKMHCEEPMILLTGKGNQQVDIEGMKAGAFDYQIKPELTVEKMEKCIRYALEKTASLKALRSNERKFRRFFELSNDSVFLTDENLRFRDVNSAMTNLFEYTREELYRISLFDLLFKRIDETLLKEQLNRFGAVDDKELEFLTQSGERKTCILSVSREVDEHKQNYMQGIIHDISNLKKAEKANLQIEKLGATARLVRILAHEIRNPLNNINLSVEQLNQDCNLDDAKIFYDIITRNSKTINDLISELLDSSKPAEIMSGQTALQIILDHAVDKAIDRLNLKKVKLELNYPKEPAYVKADSDKLSIAFLNVIINSIEAMAPENGNLRISISERGPEYMVVIQDNGEGISDENLTRLFEPYFTSKKNGLGLGLASTLNILQSHKGSVEVKSKLGVGTSFMIGLKKA